MAESGVRPSYYLPFLRNQRFVGRGTQLERVTQKLLVTKDCQKVALVGLGGVRKSQMALKSAYTVKATRSGCSILWVPALRVLSRHAQRLGGNCISLRQLAIRRT